MPKQLLLQRENERLKTPKTFKTDFGSSLTKKLIRLTIRLSDLERKKSNLHYTHGITLKLVTSGGAHLRGLAPGQYSSEETSQRWLAVGDSVSNLTGPRIEPQVSRTDSVC